MSSGTCNGTTQTVANTQYFTHADTYTNYILTQCFYKTSYTARGMNASELNYYWDQANNVGVPVSTICNNIYNSQEAATVRSGGGHIVVASENNICGSPSFGYPWTLSSQGQQCKSRPNF